MSILVYRYLSLWCVHIGSLVAVFYTTYKFSRKKLQILQNRGLKIALNKNLLYSTRLLRKEAKLADRECRARLSACRLMFKYKNNQEFIVMNGPGTRIHDGPIFKQELPSNCNYLKFVPYQFRQERNNFPPHIRLINDYDHFTTVLKRHYWNCYFGIGNTSM